MVVERHTHTSRDSPEWRLLLHASRVHLTSEHADKIRALAKEGLDWQRLLELARKHKVLPLLHRSLARSCEELVPPPTAADLKRLYLRNISINMALASRLPAVLAAFEETGIVAIPYKGLDVAMTAYGDLTQRHIGDIDIITSEADYVRACETLDGLGYQRTSDMGWEATFADASGNVKIDLHRSISAPSLPIAIDLAGWRQRLRRLNISRGAAIPSLALEDMLLVLCIQIAKDGWVGRCELKKLCDIAELLRNQPGLSLSAALDAATRVGCRRMLFLGLLAAHEVRGAPLPADVERLARADSAVNFLLEHLYDGLAATAGKAQPLAQDAVDRFAFLLRERWRDKLRPHYLRLIELVNPNERDWAFVRLPRPLYPLYYVIRPVRLAVSAAGRLFRNDAST